MAAPPPKPGQRLSFQTPSLPSHHITSHHICVQLLHCSSDAHRELQPWSPSAGMKYPLVLVLTWAGVMQSGRLSGDCPAACRCKGDGMLQRVDCVDVNLRSVPSNLSRFTFSLTLQNNQLHTVPPGALQNLKNLRSLRLDANFISRLPASSFKGLTSLHHLWLDENVLTEVPVLALSHLTELQALTMALNHISYVPDRAFSSLRRLLVLHLHGNHIHSLGRRSLAGLQNLETLDLSFNTITHFPAAIKHLSSLRDLNLQNNNISVVPENAFSRTLSIQTINIKNNPLLTVGHKSLQLLPKLHTLSLSGSSITQFPDFTGTSRLETLSITGSHISTLPGTICEDLPHLHQLNLFQNLIQSLPSFSSCTHIQHIDLTSNRLSSASLWSLHALTHLKQLRVSHQHQHRESKALSCHVKDGPSSLSLRLLHSGVSFIFIFLSLLVLLLSSAPPASMRRLLALLLWFRLLAGLFGINTDGFGFSLEDPGSGLRIFLCCLCEGCVFVMTAVVFERRTWMKSCAQISCAVGCSFTLMVSLQVVMQVSLCFARFLSALLLSSTSCFLLAIAISRKKPSLSSSRPDHLHHPQSTFPAVSFL